MCVHRVVEMNMLRGNCGLLLQVGEGIPTELSIHRQLTCTVPSSAREDAVLLPAYGQGMGFQFHAIYVQVQIDVILYSTFSPRLVTTYLLRTPAHMASKTN